MTFTSPAQFRCTTAFKLALAAFLCGVIALFQASGQESGPGQLAPGKGSGPRLGAIYKLQMAPPDRTSALRLADLGYDVDSLGEQVILFADSDELAALASLGWQFVILKPTKYPATGPAKTLGSYNGYADMTAMLDNYASTYTNLCRKMSIGKSVQGRDLWAIKVTSNHDLPQDKPKFKYISTIHGNEPIGTEMCLYLLDLLLRGYTNNNARVTSLVNNVEIWILPMVNPDGRESSPPQRYNASGYDLNRDFPEGSGTNFGNALYGPGMDTNSVQPEVFHMMSFTAAHNFSLGANFHSGDLVVNYPYDNDGLGSTFSPSPDEQLFQVLSRSYASNNAPMWANNLPPFSHGVVNGAAWYAIDGGLQDWSYRYEGIMDVTIELSTGQWPDPAASLIATYWSQNQESMLSYMEWCLRGLRGVLRDSQTGAPVRGAVRVEGYHHMVFSDAQVGDYHRLLLPGTYNVWFYAPGYIPQRFTNLVVSSGAATRLDVSMAPASTRFALKVNFQPASSPVPTGFIADTGAAYGHRASGQSFGWETTLSAANIIDRRAGRSQDTRYDTFAQMQLGGSHLWQIAVPNGPYSVLVGAGDPAFANGLYRIAAQGQLLVDGAPPAADRWLEGLGTVTVTNGELTISNGSGAISNRLDFVEISAVEPTIIAQWRALYFATVLNSGAAADTADPDQDGIPNILEYALGQSPLIADVGSPLRASLVTDATDNSLQVSFTRNSNASDITFEIQETSSLTAAWSTIASYSASTRWTGTASVLEENLSPGLVLVRVRDAQTTSGQSQRFYRLTVSQ